MAGCGDDSEPEPLPSDGPSSTVTSPTTPEPTEPTTEPTTEPATPEDEAAAEAEQTVRDYIAFTDEIAADDSIDLNRLEAFLQDPELTDSRDFFLRFRDQGLSSEGGSTTFEWVRPTAVKLYPKKGEAAVSLKVCVNLDDVRVVKAGEPVELLSPALGTYEVYNYDYPNSTSWKIAVENQPGKRCQP
ncbi:MAG: hypothetical protein WKF79_06130 [Nocardioides sp.]